MPTNEEISEMLKTKMKEAEQGTEQLKIVESKEYLSLKGSGVGGSLMMEPDGLKTGDNQFIPYKNIQSIYEKTSSSHEGELIGTNVHKTIEIMFLGGKIIFRYVGQKDDNKFILAVRKKIDEEIDEEKIENSKIEPMDEIKKAKGLLDIGALTEEEFNLIKEKYLEKI